MKRNNKTILFRKMAVSAIAGMDPTKQREYLKKRKQKKLQRFKELEEEREQEKNKWLAFANKVMYLIIIKLFSLKILNIIKLELN